MAIHIRRRDFMAVLGGAVTWPLTGVAQHEFTQFVLESTEKWGKIIRAANIKSE
jgi:hypothetical protein